MADVFVSYARTDKARVAPLVRAIESKGWTVWWDPAISPGQEFDRQISTELEAAAAVLVMWTANSVESRWVRGEARDGADRGILVPVRLGNAVLPIDFRAFHTIDLDESEDARGAKFDEVTRAIGALVARSRAGRTVDASAVAAQSSAGPQTPARVAISVLPFTSLSGEQDQQVFCDGITEDIITELARWRMLSVRSRSASFRYRGHAVDVSQVARELNVRFVVDGSIRRMGDRIRISVRLTDADSGAQVWGERFDRASSEIFAVQDEVVQTIVSTLVGRVQSSHVERVRRKPPSSLEAYECVLQGNALPWADPAGAAEATRLFEKAIDIDPDYGLAHALLATMRCSKWKDSWSESTEDLDEAYRLAMRAVELDDSESTCHSLLSQVCLHRHAYELAEQHARRSVELNPTNQWNRADMGYVLLYLDRPEEALELFTRARQLDPYFDPPWYWQYAGLCCMVLRRFEDALEMFAHIRAPSYRIDAYRASCYARIGESAPARAAAAECIGKRPDFSIRRFVSREPFRNPNVAADLAEFLRLAGLPD